MNIERWRQHGPMTDPGADVALLTGLPDDIGGLCRIIQGVLIHSDWMSAYGLPKPQPGSRETLPLSRRLRRIAEADSRPLDVPRPAPGRSAGTCRDFALMLCGMLRHRGVPARVRCGFAAYFQPGRWEDHWVCEYWDAAGPRWRLADPQLDGVLCWRLGVGFDPADIPPDMFLTAGEAWRLCRTGGSAPEAFGHGTASGLWFVRINVVRDHHALTQCEISPWDSWRSATDRHRHLSERDRAATDSLAQDPETHAAPVHPPWQA